MMLRKMKLQADQTLWKVRRRQPVAFQDLEGVDLSAFANQQTLRDHLRPVSHCGNNHAGTRR